MPPSPNQVAKGQAPATPSPVISHHTNASQVFLILGIALVVIASIVVVVYSWPELTPLLRFLVIAIPNALLFLIAYFVRRKENLAHVKELTTATGLILLPATAGFFYYQFEIYDKIDSLLIFISLVTALPIYLIFDFYGRKFYASVLTVTNLIFLSNHWRHTKNGSCFIGHFLG